MYNIGWKKLFETNKPWNVTEMQGQLAHHIAKRYMQNIAKLNHLPVQESTVR